MDIYYQAGHYYSSQNSHLGKTVDDFYSPTVCITPFENFESYPAVRKHADQYQVDFFQCPVIKIYGIFCKKTYHLVLAGNRE